MVEAMFQANFVKVRTTPQTGQLCLNFSYGIRCFSEQLIFYSVVQQKQVTTILQV